MLRKPMEPQGNPMRPAPQAGTPENFMRGAISTREAAIPVFSENPMRFGTRGPFLYSDRHSG
jgi:hypothetical protein